MLTLQRSLLVLLLFVASTLSTFSQVETLTTPKGRKYQTVKNDPLQVKIFTMSNGLRIYCSVNKSEPRIYTAIAIKAGSKNDPANATGLAHYLEHMLFKGTDKYGTTDAAKEQVYISKIESLYEDYRATKDEAKRTAIYKMIDSISNIASGLAIPNEYDKMIASIGAVGTNAFTSNEETVYINDIPANGLKKWAMIEGERFRNPVFRLFHTELEAVYEEKNISLDNDGSKMYETSWGLLFPNHQYGTQTTIGTIEHLKNPSLKEIRKFYNTYYVPNNMAVILAGDFDVDEAVEQIEKNFGTLASKPVPQWKVIEEKPLTSKVQATITSPEPESLTLLFRLPGSQHSDIPALKMVDMVLANGSAGLIDINLNQRQTVAKAGCSPTFMADYGLHSFSGNPRKGQTLEEVEKLIIEQIDNVKNGNFDEKLLPSILNDFTLSEMTGSESNSNRVFSIMNSFTKNEPWEKSVSATEDLRKVSKQQIIDAAKKYYQNYVIVYKKTGEKEAAVQVPKPAITPIQLNNDQVSDFVKMVNNEPMPELQPLFLDFSKDIQKASLSNGSQVLYTPNVLNGRFSVSYVFEQGSIVDKNAQIAFDYISYLGTNTKSAEEINVELYGLGCKMSQSVTSERTMITISGLEENAEKAISLVFDKLMNAKADPQILQNLIQDRLKRRADAKKNKNTISQALFYATAFGDYNPIKNITPLKELKALTPEQLLSIVKKYLTTEHRILVYGKNPLATYVSLLNKFEPKGALQKPTPFKSYTMKDAPTASVAIGYYPEMVQADITWYRYLEPITDPKKEAIRNLYNEYFGGGMSSVVFQEIREAKALAYSTYAFVGTGRKQTDPTYFMAFVGTQADKLADATAAMTDIINSSLRTSEQRFANAKGGMLNKFQTERITKDEILFYYTSQLDKGNTTDPRIEQFPQVKNYTFKTLESFHKAEIQGKPMTLMVLGAKDKLDMNTLKQFGPIKEYTIEELFGPEYE